MEVFVKVIAENLLAGERRIAATCFITFVAIKMENLRPYHKYFLKLRKNIGYTQPVQNARKIEKRTFKSKEMAEVLTLNKPWNI